MKQINEMRKLSKEQLQKEMKRQRDVDSEMVTGIFKNLETPGGSIEFMYKIYKGEENTHYHLVDGERYRIPRGVARHLANNCFYTEYKHLPGQSGVEGIRTGGADTGLHGRVATPTLLEARKVHRFAFLPLEFMDDNDFTPANITQVVTV